MTSPDTGSTALAAAVNVAAWGQISRVLTGRAWPGGTATIVAMMAADAAGSIEALPGWAQGAATVLTAPGNVAIRALSLSALPEGPCCGSCATGEPCEDDCPDHPPKSAPPPKAPG